MFIGRRDKFTAGEEKRKRKCVTLEYDFNSTFLILNKSRDPLVQEFGGSLSDPRPVPPRSEFGMPGRGVTCYYTGRYSVACVEGEANNFSAGHPGPAGSPHRHRPP